MQKKKGKDREFTVSADKVKGSGQQYYVKKGFVYYVMRLIPLTVIATVIGLMIAHFRGYPVREKIIQPALVKMGIPLPEEPAAEEEAATPEGAPKPDEPITTTLEISDEN